MVPRLTVWLMAAVAAVSIMGDARLAPAMAAKAQVQNLKKSPAAPSLSLTGRWSWRATCPGGSYRGAATIAHRANRFTGHLGNTSFYDKGSLSGSLNGRKASVRLNAFGQTTMLRAVLVNGRSGLEARAAYASQRFGRCQLRFIKI